MGLLLVRGQDSRSHYLRQRHAEQRGHHWCRDLPGRNLERQYLFVRGPGRHGLSLWRDRVETPS